MVEVVSISLGSSRRDKSVVWQAEGREYRLARIGVDGDMEKAGHLLAEWDGRAAAIGLGGIDLSLAAAGQVYPVADAGRLSARVRRSPLVDGSGLKASIEPLVVRRLAARGRLGPHTPVLMVSAVDRYPMAAALAETGAAVVYGDVLFGMGIDYPIRSLADLDRMAQRLLPQVVRLPHEHLYPVGAEQEAEPDDRFAAYYEEARVIAGDFHLIRRHLPPRLAGKGILTNTTTQRDVELLRQRGVSWLVTTTPRIEGRSFGTNLMEALLVAVDGADHPLAPARYEELALRLGLVGEEDEE